MLKVLKIDQVDFVALEERYLKALLILVGIFIPIKLSLTYLFLIPALILWLAARISSGTFPQLNPPIPQTLRPFLLFLLILFVSSFFGLRPLVSLGATVKFTTCCLTILMFLQLGGRYYLHFFVAVILGQSFAALHSLLESSFPESIRQVFVGTVAESGQLALVILVTAGLLGALRELAQSDKFKITLSDYALAVLILAGSLLAAIGQYFFIPPFVRIALLLGLAGGFLLQAIKILPQLFDGAELKDPGQYFRNIFRWCLPLLLSGLLCNLKRGPWLGVTIGLVIFTCIYYRKLVIPIVLLVVVTALSVPPVYSRLSDSTRDFFISGGRNTIWKVGSELILRYPIGVGYENSGFLRQFATEIPPELIHFHSNILNVTVETGWLGICLFLWWVSALVLVFFKPGIKASDTVLLRALACGIISWQVAGLVEYNFGDSEVLLLVFLIIGTGLARVRSREVESS